MTKEPNYVTKLRRLQAEGKTPQAGVWHTDVRHDIWCAIFRDEPCNCDPEINFIIDAIEAKGEKPIMTDPNELDLASLRAEVAELCRLLATGNETRAEFIETAGRTLPALAASMEQWEQRLTATLEAVRNSPALGQARQDGMLAHYATLATRVRAIEERFEELASVAIETFTIMREFLDLARGGPEA
jgi:hypothetical protein